MMTKITTHTYNFTPDEYELVCIQKVASSQDWDAGIDLAYRNILYDNDRAMWVKCPEPDFDKRRSGGYDTGQYDIYLLHEARRWNRTQNTAMAQFSRYGSWYSSFAQELDVLHYSSLVSWPYEFVMELFDTGHDPEEAARMFAIAQYERHARQREALEEGTLSQFSHPLIGHDFLYHRDDIGLTIINHRGRRKIYYTTTAEYRYTDLYLKHYFPDAQQINSRADLYKTANNRHAKYMEATHD